MTERHTETKGLKEKEASKSIKAIFQEEAEVKMLIILQKLAKATKTPCLS